MNSLSLLVKEWQEESREERLGQYFCNRYIKKPWPELFYCNSFSRALAIISKWLEDNHYTDVLPDRIIE